MAEQPQAEKQRRGSHSAGPLLLSAAAGAAAGALSVVAQKALSGGGAGGASPDTSPGESGNRKGATSFDDFEKVADDLERLVEEFRLRSRRRDPKLLVEIADAIGEYADEAANAFDATSGGAEGGVSQRRVTDDLMRRITEITSAGREEKGSPRQKSLETSGSSRKQSPS